MLNKEPIMLIRVVLVLLSALVSTGIGINVYTAREVSKEIISISKRTQSLEDWRETQSKALADAAVLNKLERESAAEALRVRVMRDVETAAATQRENVLAQLASIQRDVLRIAIILDLKAKDAAAFRQNLQPDTR